MFMPFFYLIAIVMFAFTLGFGVYTSRDVESGRKPTEAIRYQPAPSLMYAVMVIVMTGLLFVLVGFRTMSVFMTLFLTICLYDSVLLVFLPLLRKFISAKTCGWLWMLPYTCIHLYIISFRNVESPVWVFRTPVSVSSLWLDVLQIIWLVGAVVVLLWHIVTHFIYRSKLLRYAYPVTDVKIIDIFASEKALANFPENSFKLQISSQTQSPLSVGLFRRTIHVILPEKEYTAEELSLIFRHELIHIGRKDSVNKFFMLFITALFWFNPLMWIAMRCSADDLELSCDETVLLGCDQHTCHQYAELLLNTAADQRGFTTCLSASARALRYRMKNAIVPRKRWQGGVLVGILFIVLSIGIMFGDFSYNPGTAAERIFENQNPKAYICTEAAVYGEEDAEDYFDVNTEALVEYLFDLPVSQLMRRYENMGLGKGTQILLETQEEKYVLWLSDRYLRVRTFPNGEAIETCYILRQNVDWDYLAEILYTT